LTGAATGATELRVRRPNSDPIEVEVFRHLFASVAEEMGETLLRTGFSPNIKERRDYSAAVFDGSGALVSQAAHLPVHLGSMELSVRAAIEAVPMGPGDEVILNDPYAGGTHLPDVTLVLPVFLGETARPAWYVANRAHHADIGGRRPGSMALTDHIDDEGVRLSPRRLDASTEAELLSRVRTPEERAGDLAAQRAANRVGARRLEELAGLHGAATLDERASWLQVHAQAVMEALLASLPDGDYSAEDQLDGDGLGSGPIRLRVRIRIDGKRAVVDFAGSDAAVRGPVNAVYAVTLAATAYCFRCLGPSDLLSCAGSLRPIDVCVPHGSVLDAPYPAPVFGGNVETSQRVVDLVLRALAPALPGRVPAASCGSMNNVTFGGVDPVAGRRFAYYETIAGGLGGGPGGPGLSGVHAHMTNTRNTPVEALEHAFPVRVASYRLRRGSGGAGRHRGGDGVVRAYRFLGPAQVTVLTERRRFAPWGLAGGAAGSSGENVLVRGAVVRDLGGKAAVDVEHGDVLRIETPGAGGWGDPEDAGAPDESG